MLSVFLTKVRFVMEILNQAQTKSKIRRMAFQIAENHLQLDKTILLGINSNGYALAQLIQEQVTDITDTKIAIHRIKLNPAKPLESEATIEPDLNIRGKKIVLIDDVANTGRTLFYALQPLMQAMPKSVELAVMVDRSHKSFPVRSDYVGLSLATTLKENISVSLKPDNLSVHLD